MRWLIEFIVRYRNFCSLLLTTVLSVLMIIAPRADQENTARYLTMTVFYPVYVTISQVSSFTGVYAENKRLRQELAEANTQLQFIRDLSSENMRLRGLLGFAENTLYKLTPVRVVARDPSHQYRSVVVSGGSVQGVTTFMPLVGEHGAVGKVTQVMGNMSMVQLMRDPSNRTSVMVLRSRSAGILQTENGRDFFVRLRSHEDVLAGDTIITSGLGGIYPRGLKVGYVTKIDDKSNLLFKRAYMDFAVNFDRLEEVFVMRLPPQWAAQKAEIDSIKFEKK
ncbi:MAG: rod shape-determining protein MreC [Chitinispirillia bacterium]|nr:rod shape-determining protein MreC [Chitinispirillia bacterium]MCL2242551.1 rod shape-determining protein MreC [Chitinispirillia bacterium]